MLLNLKKNNSEPFSLDYLIVSKNVKMSVQEMKRLFRANKIIFDSSNSNYQIIKWKKECKVLEQEYFDVMNEGAVELIL